MTNNGNKKRKVEVICKYILRCKSNIAKKKLKKLEKKPTLLGVKKRWVQLAANRKG